MHACLVPRPSGRGTLCKDKPMRQIVCGIILCLLFLRAPLCSAEPGVSGAVEAGTGFMAGTVNEYVYKEGKQISRLAWQEEFLPAVNLAGRLNLWNFFVEAKASAALPVTGKTGCVEDYDYLLEASDAASHYSRHDVYTDKNISLSARIGYSFSLGAFVIEPLAGFSVYSRKWSAADGYLQYPETDTEPWNEDLPKNKLQGTGISYEQLLKFPCAGLYAAYTGGGGRFSIGVNALIYPYIWAEALDSHFIRSRQFFDTMEGSAGGSVEITCAWYFGASRNMGLTLSAGGEWLDTITGDTSANVIGISDDDFSLTPGYGSGTDSLAFNFRIGYVVKLGGKAR